MSQCAGLFNLNWCFSGFITCSVRFFKSETRYGECLFHVMWDTGEILMLLLGTFDMFWFWQRLWTKCDLFIWVPQVEFELRCCIAILLLIVWAFPLWIVCFFPMKNSPCFLEKVKHITPNSISCGHCKRRMSDSIEWCFSPCLTSTWYNLYSETSNKVHNDEIIQNTIIP